MRLSLTTNNHSVSATTILFGASVRQTSLSAVSTTVVTATRSPLISSPSADHNKSRSMSSNPELILLTLYMAQEGYREDREPETERDEDRDT